MWTTKISHSQLEARLDPIYYHPKYMRVIEELKSIPCNVKNLGEISKLITDGDHEKREYVEEGIPYLRTVNIKEEEIDLTHDVKYISKETHNKLKRSQLKPGNILLSIMGTIGTVALVPKDLGECNSNRTLARIVLKRDIRPEYVAAYLTTRFGKWQLERKSRGALQKRINLQDVALINIPVPHRKVQDEIAEIMQNAYKKRKTKLQKSKVLLSSIEEFILKRLDIIIPKIEEQRTFSIDHSELMGRLNVDYYQPRYMRTLKALEEQKNGKYEVRKLKDVVEFSNETIDPREEPDKKFKYIEIADVDDEFGRIDSFEEIIGKKSPSRARMVLRFGDIIVPTLKGTFKKIAIVPKELDEAIGTTGFIVLRSKEINRHFLHSVLRMEIIQKQMEQKITGAIMPAIVRREMKGIKIPIPPKLTQDEIAEKIKQLSNEAEKLRNEANRIMVEAKKRVEAVIKGEYAN